MPSLNSQYWTDGGLIKTLSILFLFATGLGSGIVCMLQIIMTGDVKSSVAAGAFLAVLTVSSHALGVQSGIAATMSGVPNITPLLAATLNNSTTTTTTSSSTGRIPSSPRSGN